MLYAAIHGLIHLNEAKARPVPILDVADGATRRCDVDFYKSLGRNCKELVSTGHQSNGLCVQVARALQSRFAMEHLKLEPLPYDMRALEPHIGRETLALHHSKHHAGYVKKLKELIAGEPMERMGLEEIIRSSEGRVFENAAQIWNHDFYWRSMHPEGGGEPSGVLKDAITADCGGFDRLRREFLDAGADHFGSGWLWLVSHREGLRITTTSDADLPLRHGDTAILCADLWEHAYYLDYHNEKARYLEAFIDHLANWEFAEANWSRATSASIRRRALQSAASGRP